MQGLAAIVSDLLGSAQILCLYICKSSASTVGGGTVMTLAWGFEPG